MNLQPYVTQIIAEVPEMEQVVIANPGVQSIAADTAALLTAAIQSVVSNRVYPLTLPQKPTYPNIVYQLAASRPDSTDGYHLTQAETYILYVRAETVADLVTTMGSLETAIESSTYSLEINDVLMDYDALQEVYRCNVELIFTVAALATQSLPAALLYPVSVTADPSVYGNMVRQREYQTFSILLMTMDSDITSLRQSIQAALLGFQVSAEYHPTEYQQGNALDGGGGLELWQEIYGDSHYIQES